MEKVLEDFNSIDDYLSYVDELIKKQREHTKMSNDLVKKEGWYYGQLSKEQTKLYEKVKDSQDNKDKIIFDLLMEINSIRSFYSEKAHKESKY